MELKSLPPRTDEEIEFLLDQRDPGDDPALPEGFADRVRGGCPFAPWEARQRRFWKVPALVLGLLSASAFALGMAPLLRLGPGTALGVWGHLLAVSLVRPAVVAIEAAPLAAKAASKSIVGNAHSTRWPRRSSRRPAFSNSATKCGSAW